MKRYILTYNNYDDLVTILGHEIPHKNLGNVKTVLVKLTDEEYEGLVGAGYTIIEDVPIKPELLSVPVTDFPNAENPPVRMLDYYNIPNAHAAGFIGSGVKIAVIDTGCNDTLHVGCPGVIRMDFTDAQDGVATEYQIHGGWGCNFLGQTHDLTTGDPLPTPYGMAYGADIFALKTMETSGDYVGYLFAGSVITAISWCIDNGVNIINVSLYVGGTGSSFVEAVNAGLLVLCASGNNSAAEVVEPANAQGLIAINTWYAGGPVTGSYLTFQNQIAVTNYNVGLVHFIGGTSQATMMASGIAAIYKQKYPLLKELELKRLLQRRALKMDGYTYHNKYSAYEDAQTFYNYMDFSPTKPNSRGVTLNRITGAGMMAPIN